MNFKKVISLSIIAGMFIASFSPAIKNTVQASGSCTTTVQWRTIPDGTDLSAITVYAMYATDWRKSDLTNASIWSIVDRLNIHLADVWSPYVLSGLGNTIFIIGSDTTPLDPNAGSGEWVEISIIDDNTTNRIINEEPSVWWEFMMYDTVTIASNNCGGGSSCWVTYQAAWELDQNDINLMATVGWHIHRSYNGSTATKWWWFTSMQEAAVKSFYS